MSAWKRRRVGRHHPFHTELHSGAGLKWVHVSAPPMHLLQKLTRRELEVLSLLAYGRTNREIAATLVIAVSTAERHVANIFAKLGVEHRSAAAVLAHRAGLVKRGLTGGAL